PFCLSVATPPAQLAPLSLHDALPISTRAGLCLPERHIMFLLLLVITFAVAAAISLLVVKFFAPSTSKIFWSILKSDLAQAWERRSEEHTSELQSRENLVCRLLLEKKK